MSSLHCNGVEIAERVRTARSAWSRLRGLFAQPIAEGEALVLEPARQIHTVGMRVPIDVVFCDREWVIVHLIREMRPGRVSRWVRNAYRAIELPAGAISDRIGLGDLVQPGLVCLGGEKDPCARNLAGLLGDEAKSVDARPRAGPISS
ncbi:MAG TPA: DUF192 domain-containing protein [Actinomycetota bacterium]|nr:DUF192 domain-containing protein [Actinomycetota bacterium]